MIGFHSQGFWRYATAGTCEGSNIHLVRPGQLLIGHDGGASDLTGAEQLAGWFRHLGWAVRLQPFAGHFGRLDRLFCMAADDLAVCCLEGLDSDFREWLVAERIEVIDARYPEAMSMSCNLLALGGGRVISAAHSARINAELRERGLTVFDPPLDGFVAGGGSARSLTAPLRRDRP